MYKVLLVDDEYLIRESLKKVIKWMQLNTIVIGEAKNGKEGLEIVRELRPDIVLTDIRMPIMDGIEFAKQIKNLFPNTKIIFISGYDDFTYAQQALRIGIEDYILKPIKNENVEQCIGDVVKKMDTEKIKLKEMHDLKVKLGQHLTIVRDSFLNHAIRGVSQVEREDVFQRLRSYGCDVLENNFFIMITTIDYFQNFIRDKSQDDVELFLYCIINVEEELLGKVFEKAVVFKSQGNEICAIIQMPKEQNNFIQQDNVKMKSLKCAKEITKVIETHLGFTVSIGIGNPYIGEESVKNIGGM